MQSLEDLICNIFWSQLTIEIFFKNFISIWSNIASTLGIQFQKWTNIECCFFFVKNRKISSSLMLPNFCLKCLWPKIVTIAFFKNHTLVNPDFVPKVVFQLQVPFFHDHSSSKIDFVLLFLFVKFEILLFLPFLFLFSELSELFFFQIFYLLF